MWAGMEPGAYRIITSDMGHYKMKQGGTMFTGEPIDPHTLPLF